jgi:transcription initiation factor TFIID TATA-box-binding protein
LQNCVATVDLDTKLNLREIVQSVHNAECVRAPHRRIFIPEVYQQRVHYMLLHRYNPKRFSAAIIRLRDPKTTALIFASGKMVCNFLEIIVNMLTSIEVITGAKSQDSCLRAAYL